ncbi:hypothetical protein THERMOS_2186 [Bathymodiolus thermophilus thioautotrophic gill symbiont]|uniref:Uncharacterized protein n=1 Tax=Bathymodiolus thermophilus thioautotrophic gill symbiont TaxID=2360 RepID=A0A8H9CGQ3_9GAMM|nr:hypothetical protein THERMOS_2186 [Bathymodiolus thermophilus thioautotrophic gill symbiont]
MLRIEIQVKATLNPYKIIAIVCFFNTIGRDEFVAHPFF